MNRRTFFGSLAALAVAPLAGAFNRRRDPWLVSLRVAPRWQDYADDYAVLDKAERVAFVRALKKAGEQIVFQPPIGPLLPSSRSG